MEWQRQDEIMHQDDAFLLGSKVKELKRLQGAKEAV